METKHLKEPLALAISLPTQFSHRLDKTQPSFFVLNPTTVTIISQTNSKNIINTV